MSKRDWFGNAALALAALCVLVAMVAAATGIIVSQYAKVHEINAAYQYNAESDRRDASQKIANACGNRVGPAFQSCIADQLESYYRDQATNEDLQAQQDMAFWAAALFISSTTLTGVGIYLLWQTLAATRETLKEAESATAAANRTVDETRRIGEAQSRAYVCLASTMLEFESATEMNIDFRLQNYGVTPAKINIRGDTVYKNLVDPQDITVKPITKKENTLVAPGQYVGYPVSVNGDPLPRILRNIKNKTFTLCFEIAITSTDIFGNKWESYYILQLEAEKEGFVLTNIGTREGIYPLHEKD